MRSVLILLLTGITLLTTSCCRSVRTAEDITPGHNCGEKLDWRYGAGDIRIQTTKLTAILMNRWYAKADCRGKPRLVITEVDNCTDTYISTEMVRDTIESIAIDDGRFTVVVGDACDEQELDAILHKTTQHPKYRNWTRPQPGQVTAPQFLVKIRITKATTADRWYDYDDYRMTITLYDIETQEAIDSAWDVLSKRIKRY